MTLFKTYLFAGVANEGVWYRSLSEILGINEQQISNSELLTEIYPNPASNFIIIKNKKTNSNLNPELSRITIKNLNGQELLTKDIKFTDNYKLDLPNLANGIYILSIQNTKENYINKLVIQK